MVLCKMARGSDLSNNFVLPLKDYLDQGRARFMDWLTVDTFSSLSTRSLAIAIAKNELYDVIIEYGQVYMATASHVVLEKWHLGY